MMRTEDKESWQNFLRYLKDRGLHGVKLVVSRRHACGASPWKNVLFMSVTVAGQIHGSPTNSAA